MTPSPDVEIKARTYLRDGHVTVLAVVPDLVRGEVIGTAPDPYAVTWTPAMGWRCTCPAVACCSHLYAVQAVTVRHLTGA